MIVEPRQHAEIPQHGADDEVADESGGGEQEGDEEQQAGGGPHPQPGFERGAEPERRGEDAEREHEPEQELRR